MRNVIILGSGRSGTSMVAGTLANAGWWAGDNLSSPRAANPKGFFETPEINGINEALIASALGPVGKYEYGQRWLSILPADIYPVADDHLAQRIKTLVTREPFAFKDPRFCYTLDAWRPFYGDNVAIICVFRDPVATTDSIIKECSEELYLASLRMDTERALAVWTTMYKRVLASVQESGALFVHYDQMFSKDHLSRIEEFVQAPIAREFPEAPLRRRYAKRPAPEPVQRLYLKLCDLAHFSPDYTAVP